jgi:hypothetical protein
MADLAEFQRNFAEALSQDGEGNRSLRSQAFAVYRNTSARGAVEGLRAAFPTIDMILGDEMFTGVALDYRREEPPAGPVLSDYGGGFPAWLSRQPWASELPYLADVARLDWLWLESFVAAELSSLPSSFGPQSRAMLHPATRFAWLQTPGLTIWQAHRDPWGFDELNPEWVEEGALITRHGDEVLVQPIDRACHYLLLLCASSPSLTQCVETVAEAYPQSNLPDLLQRCMAAGALIIR